MEDETLAPANGHSPIKQNHFDRKWGGGPVTAAHCRQDPERFAPRFQTPEAGRRPTEASPFATKASNF